jgi:hypothetical protein
MMEDGVERTESRADSEKILGRDVVDGTARIRDNMLHERAKFSNLKPGYIWGACMG